ncbi:MAG: hypothetical protein ACFCUS_02415 [Rubrimonas sp.]|uniref:hypothetical protein n=1 Tax=Rubrimonas sp. TaxID=2036015 RepID=UPI002FDDE287
MKEELAGRLADAAFMLEDAFPGFTCLRCGYDQFLLRLIVDDVAATENGECYLIETACKRCGMVEKHRVDLLRDALLSESLPRASDA